MLGKINNALKAAAELVAPSCNRIEDFRYHWQQVLQDCNKALECSVKGIAVAEETHVPKHLQEMLSILVEEYYQNTTVENLSPCIEYILQERILISLCSFALADRPLGIRQYTFVFVSKILNYLHSSYLHQMRIHRPLQALIQATCEKRASPYENQEIEFLTTLCEKIHQDSTIILMYLESKSLMAKNHSRSLSSSQLCTPQTNEDDTSSTSDFSFLDESSSKFPLIEAILNLCHSSDANICNQAHDCLFTLTSLRNERSAEAIAKHTLLPHYFASHLISTAESIPLDTEPSFIDEIDISVDIRYLDHSTEIDSTEFPGKKEVCEFLQWITYCDKVILDADAILSEGISSVIKDLFLEGFLEKFVTATDGEDIPALFSALIAKLLNIVSSSVFMNTIISWMIDDDRFDLQSESNRKILFHRCSSSSHHLQIHSLRLLQTILEKPGFFAVQELVLKYISSRSYFDTSVAEHQQNSWSDEEDERYKHREEKEIAVGTVTVSRTLAPSNIQKIVKSFMALVPEDIQSTTADDFDSYKADALRQYRDICRKVPLDKWPREALPAEVCDDTSIASRESNTESETAVFQEGPLLSLALDLLEKLPEQDYDINLQVTSLVSTLALFPHPHLHELLLNPTIPLNSEVRTPYSILSSIISNIYPKVIQKEDYKNYLKIARFQLLGTMEELEYERDEEDGKFEALIVLEEFTKELAAIAYAKFICEGSI